MVGEDDMRPLADVESLSSRVFAGALVPPAQFLVKHPRVNDHAIAEYEVAFLAGDA
jgi:hypothetical protein